jgi:lipid-A-disaccharide synthase
MAARRSLCVEEQAVYVALLPGSRRQEIRYMAEPLLLAAKLILQKNPNVRFLTSHLNEQRYQEFYEYYQKFAPDLPLQFFTRRSQDIMAAANVVVVTSGTATLETMLFKKPMVIAYRMSRLTHQLAKLLVKTPYAGLPNLLANTLLVPELIQEAARPETIASLVLDYLDHPEKVAILQNKFTQLHQDLHSSSASNLAEAVLSVVAN